MVLPLAASSGPAIGDEVEWSVRAQLQVQVQACERFVSSYKLCLSVSVSPRDLLTRQFQPRRLQNVMVNGVWCHRNKTVMQ